MTAYEHYRKMAAAERRKWLCPACHRGGYRERPAADGRPEFICMCCDHIWTCGKDGGGYRTYAEPNGDRGTDG